ncbi:MAG: site-specific integrase [Methanobacterium sp.]|nr:MAG: site-specific integrase [Methanobacterium sp.]
MELADYDIKRDKLFKDFVRQKNIKSTTEKIYVRRLKFYCDFVGLRPKQLIEEAENEIKNPNILPRDRKIKSYLLDFIDYYRKKGKSDGLIGDIVTTVKAFYTHFEVTLPKVETPSNRKNQRNTLDEIITKKHIKEAIKVCKPRDRAIILLQLSTGFRASEVRHLAYKDYLDALNDYITVDEDEIFNISKIAKKIKNIENPIGTWRIQQIKTSKHIITFSTPESINAIVDYLLIREKDNKPITNLKDPLFVTDRHNNRISENGYSYIFQRINQRAGFGRDYKGENKGKHFFTSHKLRKYFASVLYKNKLSQTKIDWMLGHSIKKVTEAYFLADIPTLKNQYMELMDELSIENVETTVLTTPAYDSLIEKLDEKEKELELVNNRLSDYEKEKTSELNNLKSELLSLKESRDQQIVEDNNWKQHLVETIEILSDYADLENPELKKRLKQATNNLNKIR